jgi:membrane fusion protein (multidrug efflux system)
MGLGESGRSRGLVLLTFFLSGIAGCEKKQDFVLPPISVEVTSVRRQDVPIYGEWLGTLDGFVNAQVRAQVSGYLLSQNYKEGVFVKKDTLLFQIDPRLFQANVDQAAAKLKQTQAQLERTQIEVNRNKPLAQEGAISQQELDNSVQSNLAAKADVDGAQAQYDKAKIDLEFTKILSPVDGIAGLANAQVGNLVGPSGEPLTTVSTVDPMKALFTISEQDYLNLVKQVPTPEERSTFRNQLEFEMIFANGQIYAEKGKFYAVQRQVDSRTGTLQIAAVFPNPGNVLRPGQFVRIRANTYTRKDVMVIPQRAVSELQSVYQVAVVGSDDKVQIRSVKVGEKFGRSWVILEGLDDGDRVIVEGLQKVSDGQQVTVTPFVEPTTAPAASGAVGGDVGGG